MNDDRRRAIHGRAGGTGDRLLSMTASVHFELQGKALDSARESVTVLEDGDLLIEGWAADFSGLDRQGENFTGGAFQHGITTFLNGSAALCFHHKHDLAIGSVLELREVEGKGLYMKARVDRQGQASPLRWIYDGIRKGSYRGLSVGGFFKRKRTPAGWRITSADVVEVSVTPVPMHPSTKLAVIAGKALEDDPADPRQVALLRAQLAATRARLAAERAQVHRAARL